MSQALVCHCLKISHGEILDFLKANPGALLKDIISQTRAGSKCQACVAPSPKGKREFYLKNILETFQRESEPLTGTILPFFSSLSLFHKIRAVEEIFKAAILPLLNRDGGNAELINIVDLEVTIKYLGACRTCPSSRAGTLEFIRETLGKSLGEKKLVVHFIE